ncbi:MAG: hypothetical protein A2Z20_04975 [Bdellovibrionales bacterium RBG_16_40_8]|nr:MAG: hypothetical protein A2Z20_04975 [Bdellovibrionales bacterium RBG_16_40_8]
MKLRRFFIGVLSIIAGLALVACSPSSSQLKKVMQDNPDILYAAIEANPKGFFDVIQKAQGKARESQMEDQMSGELKRVTEEMKSPKSVELDNSRASIGRSGAPITIVSWADFNCGHCSQAAETMEKIADTYKDKVYIVFKHLPILSEDSRMAAEYMEAIALQDKDRAWRFHSEVFEKQSEFRQGKEDFLKKIAKSVGADLGKIKKDIKGDAVKKRIDADVAEARKFEFNGTPGFMINGASVHGAYPYDFFKKVIDSVLAGDSSAKK